MRVRIPREFAQFDNLIKNCLRIIPPRAQTRAYKSQLIKAHVIGAVRCI